VGRALYTPCLSQVRGSHEKRDGTTKKGGPDSADWIFGVLGYAYLEARPDVGLAVAALPPGGDCSRAAYGDVVIGSGGDHCDVSQSCWYRYLAVVVATPGNHGSVTLEGDAVMSAAIHCYHVT
jgi:hypothetical protein